MKPEWAKENLQTIRTLMERSAVYRRALAPVMIVVGVLGLASGIIANQLNIQTARPFVVFWMAVCIIGLTLTLLMIRKQAIKDKESFWSPPTRRVAQAMLLPLVAGCLAGVVGLLRWGNTEFSFVIMIAWMELYGCALYSSGFFMQRGIRLFGCGFVLIGFGLLFTEILDCDVMSYVGLHMLMGYTFGVLHLAYGIYLYFTEKKNPVA